MKTLAAILTLLLTGCATFPQVKGRFSFSDAQGNEIGIGSDGKSIILDGSFRSQK